MDEDQITVDTLSLSLLLFQHSKDSANWKKIVLIILINAFTRHSNVARHSIMVPFYFH